MSNIPSYNDAQHPFIRDEGPHALGCRRPRVASHHSNMLRCYLIENEAVHLQSNQEQVVFLFSQCRSTIYVNYEETLVHTARVPLS